MPLLSVVVPVHEVEAELRECLDSILDQPFADIEVVAVDDRSPDRCGEILDAYAARDRRVRVVHLEENRGLGGARNAGLALATGDYVWFVDSDDWLAPGALERVAARLARQRPDILVVGHALVHSDGTSERAPGDAALAALPEQVTAADAPELVRLFPSAWNKVVRRGLLEQLDLPFPPGIYEDLPVMLPLLCAAEHVCILDEVCLHYRQRPGSILRSAGAQHLQVLDQYDLAFARLDALGGRAAAMAPEVYALMVQHLFLLLGTGRIDRPHRRRYFRRASELARRREPEGVQPPAGIEGLRHRLLRRGWLAPALALRGGYQLAKPLVHHAARGASATRTSGARGATLARKAGLYLYQLAQSCRPLDEHLAVYAAYWGRAPACNPLAIHEAARELAPHVRGVWAVTPETAATLPPDVDHVVEGTLAYHRVLARAKYLVTNASFGNRFVKRRDAVFLQTHHGTPLKAMGIDEPRDDLSPIRARREQRRLLRRCSAWDYDLSSNPYSTDVWRHGYPVPFTTLEYGYPRNDVLVSATGEQVQELRRSLGIGPGEVAVLYAPTHRGEHAANDWLLDAHVFAAALPAGHRLAVRAHYFDADRRGAPGDGASVIDLSRHPRVEELYLAADVLLTDYSSAMFDYALLDRPIVIYAPDWDEYRATRGTYFDLRAEPPGLFTERLEELVGAFRTGAVETDATRKLRASFRTRFCPFDDGRAAERVVRKLMLGEEPGPPVAAVGQP